MLPLPPVYHLRELTLRSRFFVRISMRRMPAALEGSKAIRYWWRSSSTSRVMPVTASAGLLATKKSPPVDAREIGEWAVLRFRIRSRGFGVHAVANREHIDGTSIVLAIQATSCGV